MADTLSQLAGKAIELGEAPGPARTFAGFA